ncbi:MAG: pantetheine-phosphate adenylyltransferase [Oscillibacter sp.]|nr:pantetheine-phosphate adenylyltransferase [Oscillibacter sp.]
MRTAVCSGSFDPITLGHLDIIRRTAACFDQVWVCVSPNAEKRNQMFTPEQKLQLVKAAVAEYANVHAELWPGLLADYAANHGACVIVRGVRNATDWDVERELARINEDLHAGLETMLLPAAAEYEHFSSSMVREMIRYGQPLEKYLPAAAVELVRKIREETNREEARS